MAKELGIGLIGTGWVAEAHAGNFSQIPGCTIIGVSSRKKARSQWFINHLGLRDAQPCTGCDQLLGIEGLDVVVICTPHPAHPAQTIAAARAGKHVVIEKPVALNREDLKCMVSAVNKANVLTSVCFELRWIGLFKNVRAMIDQGLIGRAYYGECSYFHGIGPWYDQYRWNIKKRMAGDALLTAGCHALDGVIWLVGSKVIEVSAFSNTSSNNPLKYEYDANSVAILKFENGAIELEKGSAFKLDSFPITTSAISENVNFLNASICSAIVYPCVSPISVATLHTYKVVAGVRLRASDMSRTKRFGRMLVYKLPGPITTTSASSIALIAIGCPGASNGFINI